MELIPAENWRARSNQLHTRQIQTRNIAHFSRNISQALCHGTLVSNPSS